MSGLDLGFSFTDIMTQINMVLALPAISGMLVFLIGVTGAALIYRMLVWATGR